MKQDRRSDIQAVTVDDAILVVDDSRMQRRILASMLGRMGYSVVEAETAQEALGICAAGAAGIRVAHQCTQ